MGCRGHRRASLSARNPFGVVTALFDTNILIDYLRGLPHAQRELTRYHTHAISIITWMEVMAGTPDGAEAETRSFLSAFTLVELDAPIAAQAVHLRQAHRLKLPDAIVWASAQTRSMLLVTRDEKAFPPDDPGVRIPYRL
jgi:predicted nucleic acid-binding protein